ncbi:3',5'-cyclic-AMP phosphodiesterase, partial [Pseudanabaenaceae cyanobacterium LEGE 13415]|nr:3',5'-cyclic-AMP phosphodiesterase [Pseudanabaenaceae cyanobacterium LEGE 13415]
MISSPLRIAQVTDLHLFAKSDQCLLGLPTLRSLKALIEQFHPLHPKPDLLLLTGDLSQDGSMESYDRLQTLFSPLQIPTYWLPGNHDCVEAMERSLTEFLPDKTFEQGGWRFLLLNSQVPGCVHGRLSIDTLDWLDRQLAEHPNLPTLVSLHHPPFTVNSTWLDSSVLQNPDEFLEILDRHPQVKLVVFGHIHQEFQHQRNKVTFLGTPSTSIQFAKESDEFALGHEMPGFRLIQLYPNGTWTSQVERVKFNYALDLA